MWKNPPVPAGGLQSNHHKKGEDKNVPKEWL